MGEFYDVKYISIKLLKREGALARIEVARRRWGFPNMLLTARVLR